MKYKLVFSYDGSKYFGYAIQKNEEHTIQAIIERALSIIFNTETKIYASGRTDKGVHALNQVATFVTDKIIDKRKTIQSLSKLVPDDIYFKKITLVSDNFDARFSAKSKEYFYVINYGEYCPFLRCYETYIKGININKMKQCSKLFIGKHCFMNFTSKPTDDNGFIREIYSIRFKNKENRLIIYFKGDGFMTYMIRKIVGTMIEYAKDSISIDEINKLIMSQKRTIITYTAIPKGLYLNKVNY